MKPLILLSLLPWLGLAAGAQAQAPNRHISLHPQHIARDADFLLHLEDRWTNGCAGQVTVSVGPDSIDVLAVPRQVPPDQVCAAVMLPIRQLIEPRQLLAEGMQFAPTVRVSYRRDNGSGPQLVESETLVFNAQPNHAIEVETGTWSTPTLDNSGLFIDEQDGLLTAALFDYSSEGHSTWFYSGSMSNGNVFVAPMLNYSTAACEGSFCPRATPVGEGRVRMLVLDRSQILVQLEGVLPQGDHGRVLQYQRLDFARSPALAGAQFAVPDLVGHWVAGVSGNLASDSGQLGTGHFGEYWIYHQGSPFVSGFRQHIFAAYSQPVSPQSVSPVPAHAPAFSISCSDYTPINGPKGCVMSGLQQTVGECRASFAFEAVGTSRLKVNAHCGSGDRRFSTEFHLFKM